MAIALDSAALLQLRGADALGFAQAQFTQDLRTLAVGKQGWSAWLDAQGRARAVFALLRTEPDTLLLWWPQGDAHQLATDLRRYVLRSRLVIEVLQGWQLLPGDPRNLPPAGMLAPQNGGWALRLPDTTTPRGVVLAPAGLPLDADAQRDWQRADLAARLPWIRAATAGQFTPQALGLEQIEAIAFAKGCYPGQEIAARLHFRGGNKRGLAVVATGAFCCAPGAPLIDDSGTTRGTVLYGSAPDPATPALALAVVALEAIDSALHPAPDASTA